MTLEEIIKVIDGKTNMNTSCNIKQIKTDTRQLNKGDLFIALKGVNYDGNDFILEAFSKGAVACITDKYECDNCILVEDTYITLYKLGHYIRNKYNVPLIAITGSNGKTTTKDLISHILSSKYKVLSNSESKNNVIGVSNTLFKLDATYDIIVMEFGTNHMGEIKDLSYMCNPDVSIITNIGTSHIGYFKTKRNIFKEKVSIVSGMSNKNLIINGDDKYLRKLKGYKCGIKSKNDLVAYNVKKTIDYIEFNIFLQSEYKVRFNNPGEHFINDILLAIKVCLDYDIKIKTIIRKIRSFKLTEKRMNIIKQGSNTIINDCYNSSLESIIAGLNYMNLIDENKIFIIGDILELGKKSVKIHKKIDKLLSKISNKTIFTVGKYSSLIKGIHFNTSKELVEYLKNKKLENNYIYIKGSRKMNLDLVVDYFLNN